ncbi:hypothetical protein KP509_25G014700 [Ceratopteris richardii]|nr:hypothetical protein KP509_25G014700 [Ceratopteris richardii]
MDVINAMQPDIWASLPDEVPSWVTHKRNKQSVERTLNWLDSCISLKKDGMESGLGCIVGGNSVEERGFCAQEVAKRDVSGFCLSGFGLGESAEERGLLLEAIMKNLPDEKARQISGLDLPEEVLQAVSAGIDVFDSTYPHSLTMSGLAMVFPLDMEECLSGRTSENANDVGSDFTKINLRAVAYRNDTSPILESCRCYTCSKHTKAYINHLLNTHEMLAQTLLDIHNTHHYMNFFQAIRNAIQGGYFADFKAWFASRRQAVNEGILVSSAA